MKGAFAINQWLIDEGYLVLKNKPKSAVKIGKADVDWLKTKAWGWGGYYSRIYINVKGREREGIVEQDDYESLRDELMAKLKELKGPNGERWENRIEKPEKVYREIKGKPPDLMVYFDQMGWRAAGTLGYSSPYLEENDTGPDDAMHSEYGMYILYGKNVEKTHKDVEIYDVAPTLLKILGGNEELKGRSIV
jgi:predicted AlkP superfamily phosphohydrolase/phosphomutase